ncbi:hypothetical protein V1511DRAFT_491236, partial [Dipodascopsis uninucleata]
MFKCAINVLTFIRLLALLYTLKYFISYSKARVTELLVLKMTISCILMILLVKSCFTDKNDL